MQIDCTTSVTSADKQIPLEIKLKLQWFQNKSQGITLL